MEKTIQRLDQSGSRPHSAALFLLAVAAMLETGCTSTKLNRARRAFYEGNLQEATEYAEALPANDNNHVLYLMERGTIAQARQDYRNATLDHLAAAAEAEELDYVSVSKGAASFVINDRVKSFRGAPYERTLLHAFTAKNYLARSMWDDAGVEARIIAERLGNLNGFPDDPYSRYLAATCLELMGDHEAAAFEYRELAKSVKNPEIDPDSGRFKGVRYGKAESELIVFVLIGRASTSPGFSHNLKWGASPYGDIYARGRHLGRSYSLNSTHRLFSMTEKKVAAMKTAKTVTRFVVKDSLAHAASKKDSALGLLVWLVLFGLEQPDTRRWETLPQWLQVARMPCPAGLTQFDIQFKNSNGVVLKTKTVSSPLQRRGSTYVSFVRDIP